MPLIIFEASSGLAPIGLFSGEGNLHCAALFLTLARYWWKWGAVVKADPLQFFFFVCMS